MSGDARGEVETIDLSGWSKIDVRGDGSCFFHCVEMAAGVSVQEQRELVSENITDEHFEAYKVLYESTRRELVNELSRKEPNNRRVRELEMLQREYRFMEACQSLSDLEQVVLTTNYWADHVAIEIVQRGLNIKTIILTQEGTEYTISAENAPEGYHVFRPDLYIVLIYELDRHYQVMMAPSGNMALKLEEVPRGIRSRASPGSFYSKIPSFIIGSRIEDNVPESDMADGETLSQQLEEFMDAGNARSNFPCNPQRGNTRVSAGKSVAKGGAGLREVKKEESELMGGKTMTQLLEEFMEQDQQEAIAAGKTFSQHIRDEVGSLDEERVGDTQMPVKIIDLGDTSSYCSSDDQGKIAGKAHRNIEPYPESPSSYKRVTLLPSWRAQHNLRNRNISSGVVGVFSKPRATRKRPKRFPNDRIQQHNNQKRKQTATKNHRQAEKTRANEARQEFLNLRIVSVTPPNR